MIEHHKITGDDRKRSLHTTGPLMLILETDTCWFTQHAGEYAPQVSWERPVQRAPSVLVYSARRGICPSSVMRTPSAASAVRAGLLSTQVNKPLKCQAMPGCASAVRAGLPCPQVNKPLKCQAMPGCASAARAGLPSPQVNKPLKCQTAPGAVSVFRAGLPSPQVNKPLKC